MSNTTTKLKALEHHIRNLTDSINGALSIVKAQEAELDKVCREYVEIKYGAKKGAVVRSTRDNTTRIKEGDEVLIANVYAVRGTERPRVTVHYRLKTSGGRGGWSTQTIDIWRNWEGINGQ